MNVAKSLSKLATGYCVMLAQRPKGTLLDELNRASGSAQSALTSQWKATQNETFLKVTTKFWQTYI